MFPVVGRLMIFQPFIFHGKLQFPSKIAKCEALVRTLVLNLIFKLDIHKFYYKPNVITHICEINFYCLFSHIKRGSNEYEEWKRRRDAKCCKDIGHFFVKKAVLAQNIDSNETCSE